MFVYCYPSDCHHFIRGKPDFIQYLLVVVICKIYFTLKTKLPIHPQTHSTVPRLLQYLLFHQLRTSFYKISNLFRSLSTYPAPNGRYFSFESLSRKILVIKCFCAVKTKPTNPYLSILPLNIATTLLLGKLML